ncbi:putative nuclease HARBI1 [Anabrus simplex]|uniref:putative nuclease HARBI1 n=1 Tax=Anabrus simplex TaxID=316456 RepID=UPI0035A334FF
MNATYTCSVTLVTVQSIPLAIWHLVVMNVVLSFLRSGTFGVTCLLIQCKVCGSNLHRKTFCTFTRSLKWTWEEKSKRNQYALRKLKILHAYLATGNSFRCLSFQFKRGETTIGKIVDEVCSAVWTTLQPEFMPAPSKELWENISERYLELWNMPNCIGAIDGKHVRIQCPRNSGSSFYNYKGYFSIVLLALVDADGLFIVIEAGDYGRNSDGGVLRNSALGRNLQQGTLNIPDPKRLPKDDDHCSPFPYFFVGDEAFPLQKHIMRPYPRRELTNERRIFNYRLSRARKSVECGFGMLASKFRVLGTAIACKPDKIDNIIRAICVLHNFIRLKDGVFSEPSVTDKDENTDNTMRVLQRLQPCNRRATVEAVELRNHLCSYFMKPNVALSWQNKYAIE